MPQNIYDNPEFFAGYSALREKDLNANNLIVRPHLLPLVGDVQGLDVLDMGCGAGELSRWLVDGGAKSAVGMDVSERMLAEAEQQPRESLTYIHSSAEDASFESDPFDLVVSVLMLHYIEDIRTLLERIYTWLRPGGRFVFCMEHPVMTAGQGIVEPGWITHDDSGLKAWTLLRYSDEGKRVSHWFVDGVVKYHRTTETMVNSLIDAGFRIERLLEPHVPEEFEQQHPELRRERERPNFLFMSAKAEK